MKIRRRDEQGMNRKIRSKGEIQRSYAKFFPISSCCALKCFGTVYEYSTSTRTVFEQREACTSTCQQSQKQSHTRPFPSFFIGQVDYYAINQDFQGSIYFDATEVAPDSLLLA